MGKLLQLAVFSPTPDQLVPLFVHAIVLNLSPSGCHLILAVRSLRHPFKIPGWCTYQVVYVHTRGIPTSVRKDATGNRLYACLRTHALLPERRLAEALNCYKHDKILLRFAFLWSPPYLRAAEKGAK